MAEFVAVFGVGDLGEGEMRAFDVRDGTSCVPTAYMNNRSGPGMLPSVAGHAAHRPRRGGCGCKL
jgi:hypothetical protein